MNPVWKITLAEKGPLQPLILFLIAQDADSARVEIAKCFPSREIVSVKPNADPFVRSEEIKEDYLNSGCESSDANEAVRRLMVECSDLFEDNEAAYGFLMEYGPVEEKENPNENCLEGYSCPACGSYGPFRIHATVGGETLVSDDGTEGVMGDVEWDDDSACRCSDCGHGGKVREFMGKPAPEFSAIQQIVANTYDGGQHACGTPDDIDTCGDGLLTFLMHELAPSEDCGSTEEAISRINVAIKQLEAVRDGLEVSSLDRMHLLKHWRVSLYEDKGDREFTMLFECQAEDADHAEDQAKNAYPNCEIVNATEIEADERSEA